MDYFSHIEKCMKYIRNYADKLNEQRISSLLEAFREVIPAF